ncbi:hypothetical protein [Verrucosispora sioxanthis]|uniref:hypothetical protein n=1 Tax=Verrucosispora sioxanthis TaxID=2499994 RepID=UPI00140C6665|nr:hypothetical protein [Verrucosispora sioxanthis]
MPNNLAACSRRSSAISTVAIPMIAATRRSTARSPSLSGMAAATSKAIAYALRASSSRPTIRAHWPSSRKTRKLPGLGERAWAWPTSPRNTRSASAS